MLHNDICNAQPKFESQLFSNMQGTELMFLCYTVYFNGFAMYLFTKILVKVLFQAIDILVFFTSNFI